MRTPISSAANEIRRRAAQYLPQKVLTVDYYRIRRRLAYPLPMESLHIPAAPVPGIANYPWATWMTWALEERINSLGWAGELFGDDAARQAATSDLIHLAQWPQYRQYPTPDLSLGHAARILANSLRQWSWLSAEARAATKSALQRIVADSAPLVEEYFCDYSDAASIIAAPDPHRIVRNISLIGAIGVALAANAADDAQHAAALNRRVESAVLALFALREDGFSEGVAYDGYVLDFIVDWLAFLPAERQSVLLEHLQFTRYLDESLWLSTPGDAAQVAEIGDVESEQMPFHISAQAKAQKLRPDKTRAWYLQQCRPEMLRADALAALQTLPETASSPPAPGAIHAQYAAVLRGGWGSEDVAVAIAASNSPLSHLHCNNGSLAIGTRGRWLIATPGYQQYIANSEREFTLGVTARNTPAINGQAQIHKSLPPIALQATAQEQAAELDLTRCYPAELELETVTRRVRLIENQLVIVEDAISGGNIQDIAYYWHGHPDAAWWIEGNWARLCDSGSTLWIGSPQIAISERDLHRLRGSRGHLTLAARAPSGGAMPTLIRWYFLISEMDPQDNELLRLHR